MSGRGADKGCWRGVIICDATSDACQLVRGVLFIGTQLEPLHRSVFTQSLIADAHSLMCH